MLPLLKILGAGLNVGRKIVLHDAKESGRQKKTFALKLFYEDFLRFFTYKKIKV